MKPARQRAVIIFIDNSAMSIDGDFLPDRLTAQINTVERYAQCLFSDNTNANADLDCMNGNSTINSYGSPNLDFDGLYPFQDPTDLFSKDSLIAVGTIGSEEFGIRTSFTSNYLRLEKTLSNITSGGTALLDRAIKLGFMALKHAPPSAQLKMIFFLNSSEIKVLENTLDDKKVAELNKKILENKKIMVNFIVIGESDLFSNCSNASNPQTDQNYNNFSNNIPSSNVAQNIQNLSSLQPNPMFNNLIQPQQFYMSNQQLQLIDPMNSERKTRPRENSTLNNSENETANVLQRIIKKAKNASIMVVHSCSTVLSDVVMATELGLQTPSGSQIIYGVPASGGHEHDNSSNVGNNNCMNINNANIRNVNSNNNIIFEPEFVYGYGPNVNVGVSDMQMIENELKQSQIPPVALASSNMTSITASPPAIKKERKAQKIKTIVFTNSASVNQQSIIPPALNNPPFEPPKPKQTRGRKPKYSASCPANQINISNSMPSNEASPAIQQILFMNYNNNDPNNNPNMNNAANDAKASLSTSNSVLLSTAAPSFPPVIQPAMMAPIQAISPPKRNTKTLKNGKSEPENSLDVMGITTAKAKQTKPTRQRKQKNTK